MTQRLQFSSIKEDRDFPHITKAWFPIPSVDLFTKSTAFMTIDMIMTSHFKGVCLLTYFKAHIYLLPCLNFITT